MFALTKIMPGVTKGFSIKLANGYTVSVQWGSSNYCQNYGDFTTDQAPNSNTAETAIIGPGGGLLEYQGDQVQGYQTPEQVLETLNYAAGL